MHFTEPTIDSIDLGSSAGWQELLVNQLSNRVLGELSETESGWIRDLIEKSGGILDFAAFNEFLLLLNQDRIGKDFFLYFFGGNRVSFDQIKQGVTKFRGSSMLAFGSFRAGLERLAHASLESIERQLAPHFTDSESIQERYRSRLPKALDIDRIDKQKTWYCGYVAKQVYESDASTLSQMLDSADEESLQELEELESSYERMGRDILSIQAAAVANTDVYLSWDHLDVYVATSMRRRWEFEQTAEFVATLESDDRIRSLNLRFFDPTQSLCHNRIDKGLVEGLMLKRAKATIYMAQEVDSIGKDSELAATLAQGKPVIAYVPEINPTVHSESLREYPLEYLEERVAMLARELDLERLDRTVFEEIDSRYVDSSDISG